MLNAFLHIVRYDLLVTLRQAVTWLTPLLFFILVVCLFPLAVGTNTELLTQIAPAIIWVAVLLASILSVDTIFKSDMETGHIDLLLLSAQPLTLIVLAKITSHWLTTGLPFILISPMLGLLLHLSWHVEIILMLTLFLGTPVLSLLGAIGAGLLMGVRHQGLLLPLLIVPLYIPILIFGTGTLLAANAGTPVSGDFALMGACGLLSLAFAPWLTGLALQTGVNQ